MFVMTSIEIIISASLYFVTFSNVLYMLCILLIASCVGGNFTIIPPCFNKIFGIELGQKVFAISGNFIGIASISGPMLTKFLIKDKTGYLIVFYVSCFILVFKMIVLCFFNEEVKCRVTIPGNFVTDESVESYKPDDSETEIEKKN